MGETTDKGVVSDETAREGSPAVSEVEDGPKGGKRDWGSKARSLTLFFARR